MPHWGPPTVDVDMAMPVHSTMPSLVTGLYFTRPTRF